MKSTIFFFKKWLVFTAILSSCYLFAQPVINSFTPISGPIGTIVTLTGTNFSSIRPNNIVYFGAVKATILSANTTTLVVNVPPGATYNPITITTNNKTAYSNKPFQVTFGGGNNFTQTSFAPKIDITTGESPSKIAIGDLDGDGRPDLAVANSHSSTVTLHRNISIDNTTQFANAVTLSNLLGAQTLCIGDLDGDGKLDLVVPNSGNREIMIFRNNSITGTISYQQPFLISIFPDHDIRDMEIRDLDGDGKSDLVFTGDMAGTISVYENTSANGTISFEPRTNFSTGTNTRGLAFCDIDGDNLPDAVTANTVSGTISILRNNSTPGNISFVTKVDFIADGSTEKVAVGDIDGDEKQDIIVTNALSNNVSVFKNLSTPGSISLASRKDYAAGINSYKVCIGDLNGDGKPDILVGNFGSDQMSALRNTTVAGDISFDPAVEYKTSTVGSLDLAIGDLNADGRPEIVVANSGYNGCCVDKTVSIFENQMGYSIILNPPGSSNPGIRVFPNPSKESLTIDTLQLEDNWERMNVFASDGKFLATYKVTNQFRVTINVTRLAAGMYFLVLYRKDGKNLTKKFIKLLH
jgi:hypothetical protein